MASSGSLIRPPRWRSESAFADTLYLLIRSQARSWAFLLGGGGPLFDACVLVEVSAQVGVEHALVRPHDLRRAAHHGRAGFEHRDRGAQPHHELHVVLD